MKSKYTLEERIRLVEEQKRSGLTICEFTKQKNIKQTTFQNWIRRVKPIKNEKLVKVDIKPVLKPEPTLIMIGNSGISNDIYSNILISLSNQNLQHGVKFDVGHQQYSPGAAAAREKIINDYGWEIIDGGLENTGI